MLKLSLNESNYNEVMKEIENKQDIDTAFRTYTTLTTYHGKKYPVYNIYVEWRDVAEDLHSRNYQWVLAGYTDNGVLYLTADEINDYNLNSYMDGEVITNLKEMIQDYPEAFYIEDAITENLNEDTFNDVNYVLSMFEDDDNLDKLYDIADRYNTSSPVSGDWDTETAHEQRAIANEFNIPLKAAKDVMINILGFDEGQFRKHKLNVVTEIRNTDMLNILYDLDDEYNALHKSRADVKQEQEAIADTFDISMDDAKWIMMDVLYFKESQFNDIDEAPSSKITSNILDMFEDEDVLDKLYDVVDKYNTSSPVSGNWNTETKHQQKTIAKEFNISLEDAKDVMINILGFDEEVFNENKSFKNRKRYTKQFNETTYNKNSFKIGDKVCSKSTYKNPANIGFCGTIIDIDKNGLCTIECADGTVIDGIRQDRLVRNKASREYD